MDAMQKKLLKTLNSLREAGINLRENPALFVWGYPEEPWIKFSLLIQETDQAELPFSEELH